MVDSTWWRAEADATYRRHVAATCNKQQRFGVLTGYTSIHKVGQLQCVVLLDLCTDQLQASLDHA